MNNLRDYYERALQEFGTCDDGNHRFKAKYAALLTGFCDRTAAVSVSLGSL